MYFSVVHKHGILETDETQRVVGFLEKPKATETTSRKQVRQIERTIEIAIKSFQKYLNRFFVIISVSLFLFPQQRRIT